MENHNRTLAVPTDPHTLHRTNDPDTSRDAAYSVDTTKLEALVLNTIKRFSRGGCIQDDILALLKGYPYSSITARFRALLDKSLIEETGERRAGKSGRKQRVLRAVIELKWSEGNPLTGVMVEYKPMDIDRSLFRRLSK